MYTFQSSLFDSQQFNDNSFFGDLDRNERLLKKDFTCQSDSDSSPESGDDEEKQLKRKPGDAKDGRIKASDARGKKDMSGQIAEDCLKEKKKAAEVPQYIAHLEWCRQLRQMRQEEERDLRGSTA